MTTDPIPTPALTPFELFEQLKAKGYQPRPCGDQAECGYCCPQALADAWDDWRGNPAAACEVMKRFLELDRREVFTIWYDGMPNWWREFDASHRAYAAGELDTCIDYILQHR